MRVIYRVKIDDLQLDRQRMFTRTQDMPYPQVPRIGEAVVIPAAASDGDLGARRVSDVIYAPEGQVMLDFEVIDVLGDIDRSIAALRKAGFREVST